MTVEPALKLIETKVASASERGYLAQLLLLKIISSTNEHIFIL
jgi:hypothetical protein